MALEREREREIYDHCSSFLNVCFQLGMPYLFRHFITRNIWFLTSIRQLKEKLEPPEARSFPPLLQASCQSSWQNALMMLQESGGKLVMRVLSTKGWSLDALPHQEINKIMKDLTTDSLYMHSHPQSILVHSQGGLEYRGNTVA